MFIKPYNNVQVQLFAGCNRNLITMFFVATKELPKFGQPPIYGLYDEPVRNLQYTVGL